MKTWSKWKSICVRWDCDGIAFLLQKRECTETGEIQFINRKVDRTFWSYRLFHRSENRLPDLF